jgi:TonB family protein
VSNFNRNDYKPAPAYAAAALSMVPGVGQIYNGDLSRGFLFLFTGAANFIFMALICRKGSFVEGAKFIATSSHIHVNSVILNCLNALDCRSPQMLLLCLLLGAFTFFCIKDALETELRLRQHETYSAEGLKISEATSGSYILHVLMFAAVLLLGLFLFVPPEIRYQAVEIEFTSEHSKTIKPIASAPPSTKDSAAEGKETKPETKPETKLEEKPEPKLETNSETHLPKPPIPPMPNMNARKLPVLPQPLPAISKSQNSTMVTPLPQPTKATATATSIAANVPQPLSAPSTVLSPFSPAPVPSYSESGRSAAQPGPAPVAISDSRDEGLGPITPAILQDAAPLDSEDYAPQPILSSEAPLTISSFSSSGSAAPEMMSFSTAGFTRISPIVGPIGAPGHEYTTIPPVRYRESAPKVWLSDFPNYGPYMEQLRIKIQRDRISPMSSKRTVVAFKIHLNGELSDLHIVQYSGDDAADKQALKAVENATSSLPPPRAPEMLLWTMPKGSEEHAEIQFTFDNELLTGQVGSVGQVESVRKRTNIDY